MKLLCFFFSSRRRHTRCSRDWSSDVCSSDLFLAAAPRWRPAARTSLRGPCSVSCTPGVAERSKHRPTRREIPAPRAGSDARARNRDRKSTRLNSSHGYISYAVFCLKKKKHRTLGMHRTHILIAPLTPLSPKMHTLTPSSHHTVSALSFT